MSNTHDRAQPLDAVIVGAGFSGMYMLHRLRGLGMYARVFEAGGGVGGTWFWNRYPGARCDVESMQYSYSFDDALQQEWAWSERYAGQAEILRYAEHVADRLDLRRDITLDTRVSSATFEGANATWLIETEHGETVQSLFCIMAVGCLSTTKLPEIPGLDAFAGESHHTGAWPHEGVDFSGKRVGVIGTGSSAIQSIPVIARQAEHLYVFQRTPNYSVPARNAPLDESHVRAWKAEYRAKREQARVNRNGILNPLNDQSALEASSDERDAEFSKRWGVGGFTFMAAYNDLALNAESNATAAEFVRRMIQETVHDPQVAEVLTPRDYPIGTKRLCVDSGYFETYNRPNVSLIDLRKAPLETITATGIRTRDAEYDVDSIVFATGFDAMTGSLTRVAIHGEGGLSLAEKWAAGPVSYLGLMVAGFPNLFTITGPGSPSVLSNMMVSIEQHVDWIADCLAHLRTHGLHRIEASEKAERDWVAHGNEVAHRTLYPSAASWYMGANVPGKPRVFMPYIGGVGVYREICDEIAADGYRGFRLSRADGEYNAPRERAGAFASARTN